MTIKYSSGTGMNGAATSRLALAFLPAASTSMSSDRPVLESPRCCATGGKQAAVPKQETIGEAVSESAIVNEPLDFELKGLDAKHPYLLGRGFTVETIGYFGLGYCSRGFPKGRVAIPLHDHDARLVGYAGRVIDDALVSEENPRYKFPGKRKVKGILHEFRKTLFVYNGFRIKAPVDDLAVVEGFTSVCPPGSRH
jgi:hypothetical protein